MNAYSHGRIESIGSALMELRYYTPMASSRGENFPTRGDLNIIDRQYPESGTLAAVEAMSDSTLKQTYMRLLKDILRVDRDEADRHKWPWLRVTNREATSAQEWLESLQVIVGDSNTAREADDGGYWTQSLGRPSYIADGTQGILDLFAEKYPHYEVVITQEPTSSSYRYGELNYRLKPELIPDSAARFRHLIPHADWSGRMSFGPGYRNASYPSYASAGHRLARNGRIVTCPANAEFTIFVAPGDFGLKSDVEALITEGRDRYRNEVRSRLAQFRTGTEAADEASAFKHREESARRFEAFRQKTFNLRTNEMLIPTLPFVEPNKGIKSSRRWGIEIETGAGRDLRGVPDQWDSKGDGSLESAYGERYIDPVDCEEDHRTTILVQEVGNAEAPEFEVDNPSYVDEDYCGGCGYVGDDYDDDDCVELVSPILTSMHSRGLRQICEDLEHAPRTESAGVHVHVEAKDLTVRQIKELVMGYDHIERFIESSYDRVERGYCKRRSSSELLDVVRQPENVSPTSMRTGDRYVTVNLQALYSHGTIEFRAMGPRYNYDHLTRWAMFCREMINVVAAGATSKLFARAKSWEDVLAIFAKYGSEYNYATLGHMSEELADQQELIEATV